MISGRATERRRLALVYIAEGFSTIASSLLTFSIFFFTREQFGWTPRQNLPLSAAIGVFYTAGALSAHPLTARLGTRWPLAACLLVLALLSLIGAAKRDSALVVCAVILTYSYLGTICWPIMETLVSRGDGSARALSGRIAIYNLVWAAAGGIVAALAGSIIERFRAGVFLLPMGACLIPGLMALFGWLEPTTNITPLEKVEPEPQLMRQRLIALWLARLVVPAMYVVIFALAALLPSLKVLQEFSPAVQTMLASIWMLSRWLVFLGLGATVFWHTRPQLLLVAAALLLGSFLAITTLSLPFMILGQVLLGVAIGMIYTASLYFGMVLTDGSAESGGHHEALIGAGMTLGPLAGFAMQWLRPGDQIAAVAAVGALVAVSIAAAGFASMRLGRRSG
jgi:hypothetical protein